MRSIKKVFVHSIKQIISICFLVVTFSLLFVFGQTQKIQEAQQLAANQTIERELIGDQTHKYRITLKANELLQIRTEQKGADVVVRLVDSNQKRLVEMSRSNSSDHLEELSFITEKAGDYEIQISSSEKNVKASNYTLQWSSRTATGKDLENRGDTLSSLKQYDKAGEFYEKALISWRKIGDKQNEIHELEKLGKLFSLSLKQDEKAVQYYEQALQISREVKDRRREAQILNSIGFTYSYHLEQYEKAKDYFEQSLVIARDMKDMKLEAFSLFELGRIYKEINQFEKAVPYFLRSLTILQETKVHYQTSNVIYDMPTATLKMIVFLYERQNETEKANEVTEQTLNILRKYNDRKQEAGFLLQLGHLIATINEAKSIQYFERSLIVFQELNNNEQQFYVLYAMASNYRIPFKKYGKALEYYEKALSLAQELKSWQKETEILSLMGRLYFELKNYVKARDYYEKIINILAQKNVTESKDNHKIFKQLASSYLQLKQYDKAIEFYEKVYDGSTNENTVLEKLLLFGRIYKEKGDYGKAQEYFDKAILYSKEKKLENEQNSILIELGLLYQLQKQYERARESFESSILHYEKTRKYFEQFGIQNEEDREFLIQSSVNKGAAESFLVRLYIEQKQYDKAKYYVNKVISSTNSPTWLKIRNLSLAFDFYEGSKNTQLAIIYGKQLVNQYQFERIEIKSFDKDTQLAYLKDKEPTYRKLADILITEGRFPEAQAVLDLLKEEEFKQFARKSSEPLFTLPYSRAEEDAIKIVDRLAVLGRELSELKAKPKDALSKEEITRLNLLEQTEIPAANKALRLAVEALAKVAPGFKDKLDARIDDNIKNILPALGKGVVALYTVVGKTTADENADDKTASKNSVNKTDDKAASDRINVGWILLVTPEIRKAYPIDTTDLEQIVFKFRQSLRSPRYDPQPLAAELYRKLFLQTSEKQKTTLAADLEETLGKEKDKTLMWSLDGILRYVPMAALHDGKGYLVEKYRNVVFNTASLGSLKDAAKSNWEVVGLGISTEGVVNDYYGKNMPFIALKDSEIELNSLVKEKDKTADEGIFPGTLKINNEFTKEALFEGARTGMPVMHISSHFYFNPAQENTSFLVLGKGNRLEMSEFQDYPSLFANVDLLSLSACDTATGNTSVAEKADGKETNGKEVESFAYQAQKLGAKSVMASLWQVSALGTKELMLKFYQIKKDQPDLAKGEALRQAQLSLLRGTNKAQSAESVEKGVEEQGKALGLMPFKKDEKVPFAHPYYWSSFILIGNWR